MIHNHAHLAAVDQRQVELHEMSPVSRWASGCSRNSTQPFLKSSNTAIKQSTRPADRDPLNNHLIPEANDLMADVAGLSA
jgi:hypothetical protein